MVLLVGSILGIVIWKSVQAKIVNKVPNTVITTDSIAREKMSYSDLIKTEFLKGERQREFLNLIDVLLAKISKGEIDLAPTPLLAQIELTYPKDARKPIVRANSESIYFNKKEGESVDVFFKRTDSNQVWSTVRAGSARNSALILCANVDSSYFDQHLKASYVSRKPNKDYPDTLEYIYKINSEKLIWLKFSVFSRYQNPKEKFPRNFHFVEISSKSFEE